MKNKSLLMTIAIFIIANRLAAQETGTYTDSRDGKTYKTVKIGTQTWMAENLAYKTDSGCWAYENNKSNVTTYGYLYNWETANNVCPAGWHLPSDAEWTTLTDYVGGESVAGGKLKSTTGWSSPNTGATNESGFTALPGGSSSNDKKYDVAGNYGSWWTSTEDDTVSAFFWNMYYNYSSAYRTRDNFNQIYDEHSVRCVRDK